MRIPRATLPASLNYDLAKLGEGALAGNDGVQISSMCAVFAESEVVGLLTKGASRQDIALAVHLAIVSRAASMLSRIGISYPIVFAGGAARNQCLIRLLEDHLGQKLLVPEQPQMLGALGAAIIAAE